VHVGGNQGSGAVADDDAHSAGNMSDEFMDVLQEDDQSQESDLQYLDACKTQQCLLEPIV